MARIYTLAIDLPRLRRNLSRLNRWKFTDDDVLKWLSDMGFVRVRGSWSANAARVNRLEPDEILRISPAYPPIAAD